MTAIDVPLDGNCLLHSIGLAFLDPTSDEEEFQRRFQLLFGTGFENDCDNLYQQFIGNYANLYKQINNDQKWRTLIDKFRLNLVKFMKSQPDDWSNIVNPVGYIPNNNNFYNTVSFDRYLEVISVPCVWLGSLEILAASLLLKCCIVVQQQSKIVATFNEQSKIILTLEYLNSKNHYNFILKCSPISKHKRKLPMTESEFTSKPVRCHLADETFKIKRFKLDNEIQTYDSSGVKRALHGTVYQLELLMLFLLRIEKLDNIFFLATEMDLAEKFDDVVLKYKMSGDKQFKWRFLQAKHKQDSMKHKITIKELTSSNDDDFSLQKYFVSFYKIKTNKYFQDAQLDDFCILTNTSFDLEIKENERSASRQLKEEWKKLFSEYRDLEKDPILFFDGDEAQEVRFKQEPSAINNLGNFIKTSLQVAISNANKKHSKIFELLANSRIVPDSVKQQIKFLNIEDFSDTILRNILQIEEKINTLDKKIIREQLFKLADNIFEVNMSATLVRTKEDLIKQKILKQDRKEKFLGELIKHLKETISIMTNIDDWLQTSSNEDSTVKIQDLKEALENFDKYFPEFILKFRFIVNYPDVDNLSLLISSEIGADEKLLTPDLFAHSFEKVMLDWFKEKDSIFLSNQESYKIQENIKVKLQTLMVTGLSKAYPEKLFSYNINFEVSIPCIYNFLVNNSFSILHLVSAEIQLTSMKLLQTLMTLKTCIGLEWLNAKDSFIFMQLDTLVLVQIQKIVIKCFSSTSESQNLLIIECGLNNNKNSEYTTLFMGLSKAIRSSPMKNKKIIFIGTKDDSFIKKFKNNKVEKYQDMTHFSDLDENSQENIMSEQVLLQGKYIQLSDILDQKSANDLLDETFLAKLIKKESIKIGDELKPYFNYNEQYYVSRELQHQNVKQSILNSGLNLFVSNITEEQLVKFKVGKENMCRFESFIFSKNIVFTESRDKTETQDKFNELCRKRNQNSIHWILFIKSHFEWKSSSGDVTKILKYIDNGSFAVPSEYSLKEDDISGFNITEKLILVADNPGMGKSTLLANVTLKIKHNNPNWWIHVINLNDYGAKNHPHGLKTIMFDDDDLVAATEFCSYLVLPSKNGSAENNFIHNLFTTSLLANLSQNLNVVLFFDGFDEISPTYKENTVKLLKALNQTNIKQIWITTRLHVKSFLEKELNIPALVLNHFTNRDKVIFLNKFLKWHLRYRETDLENAFKNLAVIENSLISERNDGLTRFIQDAVRLLEAVKAKNSIEYINYLIDRLYPSVYSWNLLLNWQRVVTTRKEDITSNPLHLKMLADVTFQRNRNFFENFNILTLYQAFVSGTFEVFFRDKKTLGDGLSGRLVEISTARKYENIHEELALDFFLSHVNITSASSYLKQEIESFSRFSESSKNEPKITIDEMLVRIGLVLFNSRKELTFIHRTIAEYFLFQWLVSHMQEEQVQEILTKVILIESDYSLTCEFFEISLNENMEKEQFVFSEKIIDSLARHERETYSNNTILHLATIRDHSNIINFLVHNFKKYDLTYLKQILVAPNRQEHTALEVANVTKNVTCFKILLNLNGLYCKDSIYFNLVSIFQNYFIKLGNTKKENDLIIFRELVLFAKRELPVENFKKFLVTPIRTVFSGDYTKPGRCNIFHVMVYFRQISNIEFLLIELQEFPILLQRLLLEKETCGIGQTPFNLALSKNYLDIITLFTTTLQTNSGILSSMFLRPDNRGIGYNRIILENPEVLKYMFKAVKQYFNPGKCVQIISALVLSYNCKKETIFFLLFKENVDKKVIIDLLDELELETIYEDILLISLYFKTTTPEFKHNFLVWFHSCIAESTHKENSAVSDLIKNANDRVSVGIDRTKYLIERFLVETDTICNTDLRYQILKDKEILLAFKLNPFINILEFLMQNCALEISESILNYLSDYPNILRTIVLDTDAFGCTILHRLTIKSKAGAIKMVLNMLSRFPDVTKDLILKANDNEEIVAHLAVATLNSEIFQTILSCTIDEDTLINLIFALNRERRNVLEIAIEQKDEDIVKIILSNINRLPKEDVLDLMLATYKHTENVLFLCLKVSNRDICTLLFQYVMEHFDTLKLKRLFVDSNHLPTVNETASGNLIFAAAQQTEFLVLDILWKHIKIFFDNNESKEYLLSTSYNEHNFLHTACSLGFFRNIEYFMEALRQSSDLEALISLLLSQNNSSEMTPLHYAVDHSQPELLKSLLQFCENNLVDLYPNLLCKLLLAPEISGCGLLLLAVKKDSLNCFSLVLSLAESLEQKRAGILQEVLLQKNLNGRTCLHNIIVEGRSDMLNMLLPVLEIYANVIDALVLNVDEEGETILHVTVYNNEDLNNIKTVLAKLTHEDTLLQIITRENRCGLTPLHKAYWNCDPTNALQDIYVQFLLDEMNQRNLDTKTFFNLQKASSVAQQFEDAIKREDQEEVTAVLNVCLDCAKELFLMSAPSYQSFLYAAYATNNVHLVKDLFEFLKVDCSLLKHVFLTNSFQYPAGHCDFEICSLILAYAKIIQDYEFYFRFLLENNVIVVLTLRKVNKKTCNLLKEETNKIGESILTVNGKLRLENLEWRYLENFRHYVESNAYTGPSQEALLKILKTEMSRRDTREKQDFK